jgi:hypothetical protein
MKSYFAAGAILMAASAPAFAGNIALQTLDLQGQAAASSGSLVLTNNVVSEAGAGFASHAFALGDGANFNENFTFSIGADSSGKTANGFAFFLSSGTQGMGTSNSNLGLTSASPLAVEFYDFGNPQNPQIGVNKGKPIYNSNLVAAIQGGSTVITPNTPYRSPYGVTSCAKAGVAGSGCLNDGDVWTADISYVAGKLTVSVEDGSKGFVTILSNYAIALTGKDYWAGFTGSTGGQTDKVSILSWSQNVPEPMTFGVFGAGLAALGMVRGRRRAA